MARITPVQRQVGRRRIQIYVRHAASVIAEHAHLLAEQHTLSPAAVKDSSHAVTRQLCALLGKEFTRQLWAAGEPIACYYYAGSAGEPLMDEHVVPLARLVQHMAQNASQFVTGTQVLAFFRSNLTCAWVPRKMNARLMASRIPQQGAKWHEVGAIERLDRIWSRYLFPSRGLPVAPPHQAGTWFHKFPEEVAWDKGFVGEPEIQLQPY